MAERDAQARGSGPEGSLVRTSGRGRHGQAGSHLTHLQFAWWMITQDRTVTAYFGVISLSLAAMIVLWMAR